VDYFFHIKLRPFNYIGFIASNDFGRCLQMVAGYGYKLMQGKFQTFSRQTKKKQDVP
jgi:hypothetical protein